MLDMLANCLFMLPESFVLCAVFIKVVALCGFPQVGSHLTHTRTYLPTYVSPPYVSFSLVSPLFILFLPPPSFLRSFLPFAYFRHPPPTFSFLLHTPPPFLLPSSSPSPPLPPPHLFPLPPPHSFPFHLPAPPPSPQITGEQTRNKPQLFRDSPK